jgi:hypothetical protein
MCWRFLAKNLFLEIWIYFDPFLPLLDKIKYFGQDKSSIAKILANIKFLNEESEKISLR